MGPLKTLERLVPRRAIYPKHPTDHPPGVTPQQPISSPVPPVKGRAKVRSLEKLVHPVRVHLLPALPKRHRLRTVPLPLAPRRRPRRTGLRLLRRALRGLDPPMEPRQPPRVAPPQAPLRPLLEPPL